MIRYRARWRNAEVEFGREDCGLYTHILEIDSPGADKDACIGQAGGLANWQTGVLLGLVLNSNSHCSDIYYPALALAIDIYSCILLRFFAALFSLLAFIFRLVLSRR